MYFPTSEQTSMQPEWQISLPSEPGHESTSASFSFSFFFPPSFFFFLSTSLFLKSAGAFVQEEQQQQQQQYQSHSENLKSDIQHSIFFSSFID